MVAFGYAIDLPKGPEMDRLATNDILVLFCLYEDDGRAGAFSAAHLRRLEDAELILRFRSSEQGEDAADDEVQLTGKGERFLRGLASHGAEQYNRLFHDTDAEKARAEEEGR